MRFRYALARTLIAAMLLTAGSQLLTLASHESTNILGFAPIAGSPVPAASGSGYITFHGVEEPRSRWTVSFEFAGLAPGTAYVVVNQGRFGEDGEPAATAFTALCSFQTDDLGSGGCWNYLLGLRRANVIQLRAQNEDGDAVLQASRAPEGPGVITSVPNVFSPAPTASPIATPPAS